MGRGRYCEGLDDAGKLAELLGDAVTLASQQRHLGTGVLDHTPCLRAKLVRLLPGLGDDGRTLGPGPAELVVGGALTAENLPGHLLTQRAGALLGLGQAVTRPLVRLRCIRLGVLASTSGVTLTSGAGRVRRAP